MTTTIYQVYEDDARLKKDSASRYIYTDHSNMHENMEAFIERKTKSIARKIYESLLTIAKNSNDPNVTIALTKQEWNGDPTSSTSVNPVLISEEVLHSYTNYDNVIFIDDEKILIKDFDARLIDNKEF